jgi:hypothetical protein
MQWSRRTTMQATAAVVVVLLAVLLWQLVGSGASEPSVARERPAPTPTGPTATGPAPPDAVWYDAAGLHHGATVRPIAIDTPPVSLALVRGGVVYEEEGSLEIWYQPWSGVPRRIGTGTYLGSQLFIGPGSDARGTTAAWFDRETLVMYDTARGVVLARKREPDRRPTLNYENAMGSRIDYVDRKRVVWTTQTVVYSFDRRSGSTRILSRQAQGAPYLVDLVPGLRAANANDERYPEVLLTRDGGKLVFHGGVGYDPIRFSPDGRYLVVIEEPAESGVYAPLVVDTRTGRSVVPVRSTTYPWVGWAYGHTLMYLQQDPDERHWGRGNLITYDARTRAVQHVTSPGDVVLPAN